MADPVPSLLSTGTSAVASVASSFSAQPAGTLLLLGMTADDYRSGNPAGWTLAQDITGGGSFFGSSLWWKYSTGSETGATYIIGSASKSSWLALAVTGCDGGAPNQSSKTSANTSAGTYALGAISTPTGSGREITLAFPAGSNSGATIGIVSYTNGYTALGSSETTTPFEIVGASYLVGNRGTAVPTTTWATGVNGAQAGGGIVVCFNAAAAGADPLTGLLMAPQRAA